MISCLNSRRNRHSSLAMDRLKNRIRVFRVFINSIEQWDLNANLFNLFFNAKCKVLIRKNGFELKICIQNPVFPKPKNWLTGPSLSWSNMVDALPNLLDPHFPMWSNGSIRSRNPDPYQFGQWSLLCNNTMTRSNRASIDDEKDYYSLFHWNLLHKPKINLSV